ncbi:hypothetical protein H6763_01130 [Candidatus Nomurabacteria bacterium]|uniref:Uncharacterized protein n=2 Tax=Bacteria candidate phyla TaxID=1783234 RepID=A0A955LVD0_UNCKA|nr:hypothetical protein [Candidatus Dojkabacteria bacterium]MCA9397203.1 hypothetical protein [candidate division WWE3 bacterium]MCB9790000.1 hypothetical protein [Candidatus Nomurabacteria bacterium]MCB9803412.1 hypothetical protein [Candidatus Nomurabacteria bacterium]
MLCNERLEVLKPEDNPDLFYGHGLDAVEFYHKNKDAKTVFEHETKQAIATQRGLDTFLEIGFGFQNIALEGIAITPEYVSKLRNSDKHDIRYLFLIDEDAQRIRNRINTRGLYDDGDKYPDWIKDIEVEWVIMYNEYYKTECMKYGLEIHNIDEIDSLKIL